MQQFSASPRELISSPLRNRALVVALIMRDVSGRYRGSYLGLLWSFVLPVMMLGVYTFIFSVVFNARWTSESNSRTEFALVLFTGLIVFNLFAECINRAPGLVLSNANYVKKVVFPLEILPLVVMGSAFFHLLASLVVWCLFYLAIFGMIPPTAVLLPVVLLPLVLLTLGLSWFLAAIGVFLRDVAQVTSVIVTSLLFLSPVFFPLSALPETYRRIIVFNPLSPAIEMARDVLVWGRLPDWGLLGAYAVVGVSVACLGFAWFQRTRKGFADVI